MPVTLCVCVCARAPVFWGKQPYVYCSCRTHDAVGDKRGILTAPPSSGDDVNKLSIGQKGTRRTSADKPSSLYYIHVIHLLQPENLLFLCKTSSSFAPAALYFMTGVGYVPEPDRGKRACF